MLQTIGKKAQVQQAYWYHFHRHSYCFLTLCRLLFYRRVLLKNVLQMVAGRRNVRWLTFTIYIDTNWQHLHSLYKLYSLQHSSALKMSHSVVYSVLQAYRLETFQSVALKWQMYFDDGIHFHNISVSVSRGKKRGENL